MLRSLEATVRFNRPLRRDDNISPGAYDMTIGGRNFRFDFMDFYGTIDPEDPSILYIEHEHLDVGSFPDSKNIDVPEVEKIIEFFIDCDEDLVPCELIDLCLYDDYLAYPAGKDVISEAVLTY